MLKNIHKTILAGDQADENIEFSNYTNFIHHFNKLPILYNELILIINKNHLSKSKSHHTLLKSL